MKVFFFCLVAFAATACCLNAQNTIPTTTCTGALSVNDSLRVSRDITANGDITSRGEIISKDTIRAEKDIKVDGNISVDGKISSNGIINTESGFYVRGNQVISMLPPIGNPTSDPFSPPQPGTNPIQVYIGPVPATPLVVSTACSDGEYNPWVPVTNNLGGQIQIYDNTGPGYSFPTGGSILKMASWNNGSSIDVSGGTIAGGSGGLLMNYFCGKNIFMCTGANGGVVGMGKNVEIGNVWSHDNTANLNINAGGSATKGIKVFNGALGDVFTVFSDGRTQIGLGKPKAGGQAANAKLSVDGLILAKEVKIAIATTHWADYVFEKNYKLMPLKEVEHFIKANSHLPDVPSAKEVEENGINVVETNAVLLRKIEELTLYLIEQNKRIEHLEKENLKFQSKK